jgi:hypothetical protein
MTILEVTDKILSKEFIDFPKRHYKNDRNWVCPLDVEIEGIFDPANNACFQHGEAIRWLLKDDSQKTIGRIAAFVDHNKVNVFRQPTGGAGFFECINNQEAANMLFDTAKAWLQERGMEAMEAPVNFGENFVYWGLLVEGFMQQAYGMQYNFPYYKELYENYGFQNFFEQYSYHVDLSLPFNERLVKFAEYIESRPNYTFEHFNFKNTEKYVNDLVETYNTIWSGFHKSYSPLKHEEIWKMLKESKPVIDEEFIWFAYDNGKPIAMVIIFPDINQLLKKLGNGKLNLINKLKFLYYKNLSKEITRTRVFVAGVSPDYQNSGIISALFYQFVKILRKRPQHKEIELSWVGDYNPKMISVYDKIGGVKAKTHITYMHLFDKDAEFIRFNNEFEGKLYL